MASSITSGDSDVGEDTTVGTIGDSSNADRTADVVTCRDMIVLPVAKENETHRVFEILHLAFDRYGRPTGNCSKFYLPDGDEVNMYRCLYEYRVTEVSPETMDPAYCKMMSLMWFDDTGGAQPCIFDASAANHGL